MPLPEGRIIGNPADADSLQATENETLPENVEVASEPILIPTDASFLSANDVKKYLVSVSLL